VEYDKVISLLLLSLLAQNYYTPQEAQEIFSRAGEAYYREDYPAAKQEYLKLLSHGFGGSDVLYNLGTTCLNQGDLGEAVLYLERARRLGGSTPDIEANLAVARSRQLDQVVSFSSNGWRTPFVNERWASRLY
jgi:tetratricopeptide (TPR) repeat protein